MAKPERDAKGHFKKKSVVAPIEEILDAIEPEPEITEEPQEAAESAETPQDGATPTLPILVAVNGLLASIRAKNPEVPTVSLVLGAQGATRRGQVHGHFAPNRWANPAFADAQTDEEALHEIMLSGESLQRGAVATLGTLLHECAHAIANARGVKDTSNNGRYHNKRFKAIAEELGIELTEAPTLGWSLTSVPEATIEEYKNEVTTLGNALVTYRRPPEAKPKAPRKTTKFKITCECEDNEVTVSKQWFERNEGALKCDNCLTDYRVAE